MALTAQTKAQSVGASEPKIVCWLMPVKGGVPLMHHFNSHLSEMPKITQTLIFFNVRDTTRV